MAHEYYIINTNDSHFTPILAISTDFVKNKPKYSLDETKAVLQIRDKIKPPPFMDEYTPLTQEEAAALMQTAEWQTPEPI
jgi:hypothetical protein